ncbi:hypothetical protein COLO4_33106 [Corchorus olitorius]|uniref:Uncharacterized protein n=1 Tax=Corchorus olitorius TaxID=93759 RepID=A0A1R3GWC0_9ROSI|nr:hypothetical protein COLO4_33106 [Corchorus olitorius]
MLFTSSSTFKCPKLISDPTLPPTGPQDLRVRERRFSLERKNPERENGMNQSLCQIVANGIRD